MSGVTIYLEGGGNSAATKAALRQGMDAFLSPLKEKTRDKTLRWKLVCCGGRDQACEAFLHEYRSGDSDVIALIVDAEGPVTTSAATHLTTRDGWNLVGIADDHLHLMVQTMEAWIVADPDTLSAYYGQRFNRNQLPRAQNIESVAKLDVARALREATRHTQKGAYRKIRHASDLLSRIDRDMVRKRCPNCNRLFTMLGDAIEKA